MVHLGVLFLRFMCPLDCSCMINFIEVYPFVPNERYRLVNPCLHKLRIYLLSVNLIRRLFCSNVELKTVHWAHCRWKWQRLAVFRSSAEGKKIKHLSKWGVVNTGRPLHVKYWGVATSATPAALTPMPLTSSISWPLGERPIYLKPKAAMPNFCFLRPNIMKSDCTNITICNYSAPVGEHSIVMSGLSVCPRSPELRRTDDLRHFMRVIWPWLVLFLVVTIRYDTRCYFNVRSKADMSQLNLPHGYVGLHQVCGWHHICT